MTCATALVFQDIYRGRGFSPLTTSWTRYGLAYDLIESLGLFQGGLRLLTPVEASEDELRLVHTPDYIARVWEADARGEGALDGRDTPAWRGMYRRAALAVGGTLLGARAIMHGEVSHAFNPAGGLHHARADRASGFCIFNDIVIATRLLQREFGLERIAIIDVDGHHGDGTQALLYNEAILKVSLHQYDGRFYPGTGSTVERGAGGGYLYNINLPLTRRVGDAFYQNSFDLFVPPLLHQYRPQFIIVQFGADAHVSDPLVGLRLTTDTYVHLIQRLHQMAHLLCDGRLLFLGGGGYNPRTVARVWAILTATLSGALPAWARTDYQALFDTERPPVDVEAEVATTGPLSNLYEGVRDYWRLWDVPPDWLD
ncbi:MAG: acetoin utilization protein AcuC [Anaerolineae bacterium]|nr:acetoin utilization protein AcuC [Anaerolineae bacterium]